MDSKELEIKVGTPATMSLVSDRYSMDVVRVTRAGVIYCQFRGSGEIVRVRRSKDGAYRTLGRIYPSFRVSFGVAEDYQCPEF